MSFIRSLVCSEFKNVCETFYFIFCFIFFLFFCPTLRLLPSMPRAGSDTHLPQTCKKLQMWQCCRLLSAALLLFLLHFDFICIEMKTFQARQRAKLYNLAEMRPQLELSVAVTVTGTHTGQHTQLYRRIGPVSLFHKQNGGHCNCCRGCTFSPVYAGALPMQLCHTFVGYTPTNTRTLVCVCIYTHTHTQSYICRWDCCSL